MLVKFWFEELNVLVLLRKYSQVSLFRISAILGE